MILSTSSNVGKKLRDAKKRASGDALSMKEDEMDMRMKKRRAKEAADQKYDNLIKSSITGKKMADMRSQELLRAEMQYAYKQGETDGTIDLSSKRGCLRYR